jgi:hypothetical protein
MRRKEESAWHATPQGRRQTPRGFERAPRKGALGRSEGPKLQQSDPKTLERLMEHAGHAATRPVSIRIPIAGLGRTRQIADETGVGCQTVLKWAIRKDLKKAS